VWLFIAVLSSANHFDARDAIRRTWGSGQSLVPLRARLAFFLAAPQEALVQRQVTGFIRLVPLLTNNLFAID
jgi:hypothetical protein